MILLGLFHFGFVEFGSVPPFGGFPSRNVIIYNVDEFPSPVTEKSLFAFVKTAPLKRVNTSSRAHEIRIYNFTSVRSRLGYFRSYPPLSLFRHSFIAFLLM